MNKAVLFALAPIISLLILIPTQSFAQDDPSIPSQISDVQEQISSTIDPTTPNPGQTVTITLEAYGTDLNRATITWVHNGKQELTGQGEAKFTFTASALGQTDNIVATVKPSNGPAVVKSFTISPSEVDLLWEADTYTPPFYKGKALFTPQSSLTFVAIPNMIIGGKHVSSDKVVYTWSEDFSVAGDMSGLGKNTYPYTAPIINDFHVFQVDAYSSDNPNVTATSKTNVTVSDPSINIYEDNPLYGVLFNHALLDSFRMDDNEKKIAAYPFFFSTNNKNLGVSYQWTINDATVPAPATQNSMTFRKTNQDTGTANVSIKVDDTNVLLQEAFGNLTLFFDKASTGVFLKQ